jgi:hypothetical protein
VRSPDQFRWKEQFGALFILCIVLILTFDLKGDVTTPVWGTLHRTARSDCNRLFGLSTFVRRPNSVRIGFCPANAEWQSAAFYGNVDSARSARCHKYSLTINSNGFRSYVTWFLLLGLHCGFCALGVFCCFWTLVLSFFLLFFFPCWECFPFMYWLMMFV